MNFFFFPCREKQITLETKLKLKQVIEDFLSQNEFRKKQTNL
jgi:hypothetical protein